MAQNTHSFSSQSQSFVDKGLVFVHSKINADIGRADDPATKAMFEFVGEALKK